MSNSSFWSTQKGRATYSCSISCQVTGVLIKALKSPSSYKNAGFDRYYQIFVGRFRDEDLRGDRQTEFTQEVDLETLPVTEQEIQILRKFNRACHERNQGD